MFLACASLRPFPCSLPRIRGGVSSPEFAQPGYDAVFPAYAGVFLKPGLSPAFPGSLPRIRGGVSCTQLAQTLSAESSPHTRGCFYRVAVKVYAVLVFPAYAGVFPARNLPSRDMTRLPRIRGGVSVLTVRRSAFARSSPHTRGCFPSSLTIPRSARVFPAYAGVFPPSRSASPDGLSLPRIRGGVSILCALSHFLQRSSPHTRGCFHREDEGHHSVEVFPAYAGVFPPRLRESSRRAGLPRIRGGVSHEELPSDIPEASSPHTRGCFSFSTDFRGNPCVFPAYAGVFPAAL